MHKIQLLDPLLQTLDLISVHTYAFALPPPPQHFSYVIRLLLYDLILESEVNFLFRLFLSETINEFY